MIEDTLTWLNREFFKIFENSGLARRPPEPRVVDVGAMLGSWDRADMSLQIWKLLGAVYCGL